MRTFKLNDAIQYETVCVHVCSSIMMVIDGEYLNECEIQFPSFLILEDSTLDREASRQMNTDD